MSDTVFAWTEPEGALPAYINVREHGDAYRIAVRASGTAAIEEIDLPREELVSMGKAICEHFDAQPPSPEVAG